MEEKLKEYIENIEDLSADARYSSDYKQYEKLKMYFDSIIYWADKANKVLNKIEKEGK